MDEILNGFSIQVDYPGKGGKLVAVPWGRSRLLGVSPWEPCLVSCPFSPLCPMATMSWTASLHDVFVVAALPRSQKHWGHLFMDRDLETKPFVFSLFLDHADIWTSKKHKIRILFFWRRSITPTSLCCFQVFPSAYAWTENKAMAEILILNVVVYINSLLMY